MVADVGFEIVPGPVQLYVTPEAEDEAVNVVEGAEQVRTEEEAEAETDIVPPVPEQGPFSRKTR